jgi:hypothetical protein
MLNFEWKDRGKEQGARCMAKGTRSKEKGSRI